MGRQRRGRIWLAGEYLGLVSTKPKPTARQALRAFLYTLPAILLAAVAAALVADAGAPEWLIFFIRGLPILVMMGLLTRAGRMRP